MLNNGEFSYLGYLEEKSLANRNEIQRKLWRLVISLPMFSPANVFRYMVSIHNKDE